MESTIAAMSESEFISGWTGKRVATFGLNQILIELGESSGKGSQGAGRRVARQWAFLGSVRTSPLDKWKRTWAEKHHE